MNGVKKAQMNGCPLQVPIYDIAYEATENRLFALGFGGMVYQIDADTMIVTNSTNVDTSGDYYAREGLSIFINDTVNRFYVIYAADYYIGNQYAQSISYMGDTNNLTQYAIYIGQASLQSPIYTRVVYDLFGARLFYIYSDPANTYTQIDEVALNLNSFSYTKYVYIDSHNINVDDGIFISDSLLIWGWTHSGNSFTNHIYEFIPYSSYSNTNPIDPAGVTVVLNGGQYYNPSTTTPPFGNLFGSGNLGFQPLGIWESSTSVYTIYQSTALSGSAFNQIPFPINNASHTVPRSLILFPIQQYLTLSIVDETKQVAFIATGQGQVQKYSYSNINYMILNSTYNFDNNLIDEIAPNLDSQISNLINSRIFYASSDDNGGIWMMPLSACEYQTSCADCISLGDPYCGWCPLSNSCTTQSTCATHALTNGWSQSSCPSIQQVSSPPVPIQTQIPVSISTSLIPNPGGSVSNWMCIFTRSNSQNYTTTVTADDLVAQTFNCTTPAFNPPLSNNFNESVTVTLSYQGAPVVSLANAITIYDCAVFDTCNTCQQTPSLYNCGWCVLENTCTTQSLCPFNTTSSWLNSGSCPIITTQITPIQIPVQSTNLINITISPAPVTTYQCIVDSPPANVSSANVISDGSLGVIITCVLPAFLETQIIQLSIAYNNTVITTSNSFSNISVYDCALDPSTCESCVSQTFPQSPACAWDSSTNTCNVYNPAFTGPPTSNCPRITSLSNNLFGSYPASNITVSGTNISAPFGDISIACTFQLGAILQTTSATYLSGTAIQCATPTCFSNPTTGFTSNVALTVTRGDQVLTHNFSAGGNNITFVTCVVFSGSCQTCLEQAPLCGWCSNTSSCMSSSGSDCPTGDFNTTNCPSAPPPPPPIITSFFPTSGPVAGGTVVEIRGFYLGNSASDIVSITFPDGNFCQVIGWINSTTLLCTTIPWSPPSTFNITVNIANQTTTSTQTFTYTDDPEITGFEPMESLVIGGSLITVNVSQQFSSAIVLIGTSPCVIQTYGVKSLTCITSEAPSNEDAFYNMTLIIGNSQSTLTNTPFHYQALPSVIQLSPPTSAYSSGDVLQLIGSNLLANLTGEPITIYIAGQFVNPIDALNNTIRFVVPTFPPTRKRVPIILQETIIVIYGTAYNYTVPFFFTIYPDPQITNVTAPIIQTTQQVSAGATLFIVGTDLNSGLSPEVFILIPPSSGAVCGITALANNLIVCTIDPNSGYVAHTGDLLVLDLGGNATAQFAMPLYGSSGNGTTPTTPPPTESPAASQNPAGWLLPLLAIVTFCAFALLGSVVLCMRNSNGNGYINISKNIQ